MLIVNSPRELVLVIRLKGILVKAVSSRLECTPTKIPDTGLRLWASTTKPDILSESIWSPVAKQKVKPSNLLRSLLSTIASVKSIVYVVFGKRESRNCTFTFFPNALMVGAVFCGGEIITFSKLLSTSTISSKKSSTVGVVTLRASCSGMLFKYFGGIRSLGPPWGPWPLLAHPKMVNNDTDSIIKKVIIIYIFSFITII